MKTILICIFKFILKFIYFFLKVLPTNSRKISFISRQTDDINIDFAMIRDELLKKNNSLKLVFICERIKPHVLGKIKYGFTILKQMYHIATSRMVILDSYCIPICILNHKKDLTVLQIWHSIGKIKKSGYQTLDTKSGHSKKMATLMCMHKNYDKIIAGGVSFNEFYKAGFNVEEDKLLNYGLPRIDYLINNEKNIRKKIYLKYPNLKNKKIVYYTPTFRKYEFIGLKNIMKHYNEQDFILIVRGHPNQRISIDDDKVFEFNDFKSTELLTIADYVITDYSSICLEAACLNKKVLFYIYDYDRYTKENGINLDVKKVLPTCSFENIEKLLEVIKNDTYDNDSYQKFRKDYLPQNLGKSTSLIVKYILKNINC